MEQLPPAARHEDFDELDFPDDPPEDEEDDAGEDERENEAGKQRRFEADRRIKNSPEIQAHILAFYLEGVPRGEIAKSLEKFGLKCGKGIAALQTANLHALRDSTNLAGIRPQRDEARQYIIEKLPHLAWRLLPRSRAFLAHCLDETRASLKVIAEASDAYMKSIDPNLPGAPDTALSDLQNSEKGGGSREALARYFRRRPHKLTDAQLAKAREEVEARFGEAFRKQESLSRFKSDWILDDLNRSLLVALLDLGEEKARPSAIAWAIAKSIPKSGTTLSFVVINRDTFHGYKGFADAIRVGTEAIAPGLTARAEELIAEYDKKIETGKIPEWRRSDEQKAFLCFLLQETSLSTDLMSWAHSAQFGTPVKHSALKEYIRSRGGNAAYALELRAQITDEQLRAASAVDLTKLPGYRELSPPRKRSVDMVALESFKPLQCIAENIRKRERSSVSRVNLHYGRSALQEERDGRLVAVNPEGTLPETVVIEFLASVPKTADEGARRASENAKRLRALLIQELTWISEKQTRSTGGDISTLTHALVDLEKTGEPIRTVTVRWQEYNARGKVEQGSARFQLHRLYIDAVRDSIRRKEQTAAARADSAGNDDSSGGETV